ncbi:MAG: GGDEF domain-containing phosphodiesterase [Parasphingorhabdus sp.]|nr:GGDEF domain-containing phosphodiesterase [Parasphingorhabdus sp.]
MAIAEFNRFSLLRRQIGHKLANRLIAGLADRLRDNDTGCELGRIGRTSFEFAFTSASIALAEVQLKTLAAILEREIDIDGYRFQLPVVIGAAEIFDHPVDEELTDRAAAAVTEAQEMHRKVRVNGRDFATENNVIGQLDLMRDLRSAITSGGLKLHYQPKLRARTNQIHAAEALLRWVHPIQGLLPTDKLVAAAEASGAIYDLTRWVIGQAMQDQNSLIEQGFEISIYINLSGALVADTEFCRWAIDPLTRANGTFGFEITETAVIDDPERALANLELFSAAGIKIAIDDYGTGLSSLAYLKQLPANELKIDRMFISGLTDSHRDPLLVRSSIDLAHALEMDVTAEGVTDPMTLALLRVMGCDLIQGYLISHPLPLAKFGEFLAENGDADTQWGLAAGGAEWDISTAAAAMDKS